MDRNAIPEFMQAFYDGCDIEGKQRLNQLAQRYYDERATFLQTTFVAKKEFLSDWNRKTGQRKELTAEEALKPMEQTYTRDAKRLAYDHGYRQLDSEKFEQLLNTAKHKQSQTSERLGSRDAFISNLKSVRERNGQRLTPRH